MTKTESNKGAEGPTDGFDIKALYDLLGSPEEFEQACTDGGPCDDYEGVKITNELVRTYFFESQYGVDPIEVVIEGPNWIHNRYSDGTHFVVDMDGVGVVVSPGWYKFEVVMKDESHPFLSD